MSEDFLDEIFDNVRIENFRENELTNHVVIVLDQSSSMLSIQDEIIDAMNKQLDQIKEETGDMKTTLSFVVFDSDVSERFWKKNIHQCTMKDFIYSPCGMTAMYDGVGYTLKKMIDEDNGDEKTSYLVIVVSDGQENASKEYHSENIASMVSEAESTNRWTFNYLGANQDLGDVSKHMGTTQVNNYIDFAATKRGMDDFQAKYTCSTSNYFSDRKKGFTSSKDLYKIEDDKE